MGWALIPLMAGLGAWASLQSGWTRILLYLAASLGHGGAWLILSPGAGSLAVRSAVFDAGVASSYFLAFAWLGEPVSPGQWAGAALVVAGVALLS